MWSTQCLSILWSRHDHPPSQNPHPPPLFPTPITRTPFSLPACSPLFPSFSLNFHSSHSASLHSHPHSSLPTNSPHSPLPNSSSPFPHYPLPTHPKGEEGEKGRPPLGPPPPPPRPPPTPSSPPPPPPNCASCLIVHIHYTSIFQMVHGIQLLVGACSAFCSSLP